MPKNQLHDLLRQLGPSTIEQMSESVFWIESSGRVLYANPRAALSLGYSPEELVELSIFELTAAFTRESWAQYWAGFQPNEARVVESTLRRKDGSLFPVEVSVNHLVIDGKTIHCSLVRDSTARLQAEKALRDSQEQLQQAQRLESVGRLAGGVAHDFNNLLTAIRGYGEILQEDLGPDDARQENLTEIIKAAERASILTRQLLAFSRKQILQPANLNLNKTLADMEQLLKHLLGEDIPLTFVLAKDLGLTFADASQIEQIVVNLAVNARDAMSEGGRLVIETSEAVIGDQLIPERPYSKPGRYILLSITDFGRGMDAETQAHIFEPFFTTKSRFKGTGLGLSTVYGIVKQSGGFIWVYSEVGVGTTFKIYLPRLEDGTQIAQVPKRRPSAVQAGLTVLLVEDEDAIRSLARYILEKSGFHVLEARNPEVALKLAEAHPGKIGLLLSDVVLPEISGPALAKKIAPNQAQMKVLFMSGYPDSAIAHHGILEAGTYFLQKPFTPGDLTEKVLEVLASS